MHALTQEQVESVKFAIWEMFQDQAVVRVFSLRAGEGDGFSCIGLHIETERVYLTQVRRVWFDAWVRTLLKAHHVRLYYLERGQALRPIDQVAMLMGSLLSEKKNYFSSPRRYF